MTQLDRTPGLVGYSLKAKPLRRDFWTLSVWEGGPALAEFVRAQPHEHVMGALQGDMGATKFVRWKTTGSEVPPRWDDATERATGR